MAQKEKQKPHRKPSLRLLSILLVVILVLLCSFGAYAWLVLEDKGVNNQIAITDLNVTCNIYFVKGEGEKNTVTLEDLKSETSYEFKDPMLRVSLQDGANVNNYIGNMRVVVNFTGGSPAYIRVRLFEQWTANDVFLPSILTPYTIAEPGAIFPTDGVLEKIQNFVFPSWRQSSNLNKPEDVEWFDNRINDFSYYYAAPVYPDDFSASSNGQISMLLINGITPDNISGMINMTNAELQMIIEAEAVQPNRFREFFDLEKLPWDTTPPAS